MNPRIAESVPLRAIDGRLLLTVMALTALGLWVYRLALPLAVLAVTHSAGATAMMYVMEFVPSIVLGPLAGLSADRWPREWLLVSTQGFAALLAGLFALWVAYHAPPVGIFWGFGLALASSQVFFYPAMHRLIAESVVPHALAQLNARMQTIDGVFGAVGPALGAGITTVIGVPGALVGVAGTLGTAALVLLYAAATHRRGNSSPPAAPIEAPSTRIWTYFRDHRDVWAGVLVFGGINFGLMTMEANLIFVVVHILHLSRADAGLVLGAGGVGALLGSLVAPRIGRWRPAGIVITACLLAQGVLTGAMGVPSGPALGILWGMTSGLVSVVVVTWFTFQQTYVPPALMGRVTAVGRMVSFAAIPLGAVVGAWALGTGGLWRLSLLAGSAQVLMAALGRGSALWRAGQRASTS